MKTNPNDPINPTNDNNHVVNTEIVQMFGLTKREHFAIETLKGILSNSVYSNGSFTQRHKIKMAVSYADDLINELNSNQ